MATVHNRVREEWIPTRKSLLTRLKNWDDQESWQEFFQTYWRLVYSVALKSGLSDAEAQDVVQETVVSVAKQMRGFKYDPAVGSFKNWLLLITRRRISDHLRKQYQRPPQHIPAKDVEDRTRTIDRIPDPGGPELEALWETEWQKSLLDHALERVRSRVDPKQFQIFDCYALKQWPVKDVAKTFHVTTGQVYLIKHRLSALLKKEAELLGHRLD